MTNKITETLGIKYPIIQGPMAFVSLAPLAAAVSNAGGLGVLGIGFMPEKDMREQITKTKELTDKPFAAHVFLAKGKVEVMDQVISDLRPPVVYASSFNLNPDLAKEYMTKWKNLGLKVIFKTVDAQDAKTAEEAGADVIVAHGWEGGGHLSPEATTALIPAVTSAVNIPVVAGGGIADGRGFAAALALGASGIEMGTRFLVTPEAPIHEKAKEAIAKAPDMSTEIVSRAIDNPFRILRNNFSKKEQTFEAENTKKDAAEKERGLDFKAEIDGLLHGNVKDGAVVSGQQTALINSIEPVSKVITDIMDGTRKQLDRLSKVEL